MGMLDFDLGDFLSYLRSAKSGFTSMVKRHPRGLAYLTLLYSVLFMYFQQTLLVDGLSYTLAGPFELHLLPGRWVQVSAIPPIPSMPFPLWGWPYVSVTTNYFDLSLTPFSLGITLSESFLVSSVIFLYLDIYSAVRKGFSRARLGAAQTLTLTTVFLSCSCEFFEGILAAVEPAAGIISSNIPSLLPVVDEVFLIFSLTILLFSTVFLSARMRGVNLEKRVPSEYIWLGVFGLPFTVFVLLGGGLRVVSAVLGLEAFLLAASRLTRNRSLAVYPIPIVAYAALSSVSHQAGLSAHTDELALTLSMILALIVGVKSQFGSRALVALPLVAGVGSLFNPWLTAAPFTTLLTSWLTSNRATTLKDYLIYQTLSWTPIMLGPIAVAYRPVPPIPTLSLQSQVEFYVYLWLIFTPVTWYLGIKSIFWLMSRAGVDNIHEGAKLGLSLTKIRLEDVLIAAGVFALVTQFIFYYAEPQMFLASSFTSQTRSLTITTTSLTLSVIGLTLLVTGVKKIVLSGRIAALRGVAQILSDTSKRRTYRTTLLSYLGFSLISAGTFAWGSPPYVHTPSLGVFPAGPLLYAPSLTIYLTNHFGFVLVPEHILVATITSVLVATSYKALALVPSATRRAKRAGLLGSAPGVVLSCPTCTLTPIYSLLGINSAISGLGILAAPFFGTFVLAATWIGLVSTIAYASRKIDAHTRPPYARVGGHKP